MTLSYGKSISTQATSLTWASRSRFGGMVSSILRRVPYEPDRMGKIVEPGMTSREAAMEIYEEITRIFYRVVFGNPDEFFAEA